MASVAGLALLVTVAGASDDLAPFVSGFDRFGRHEEIDAAQAGRLLLTELSCTACHATTDERLAPKRGPRLSGLANRVSRDWVRRFVKNPAQVKPGTTMPHVLSGVPPQDRSSTVTALLAFLMTQHEPWPQLKAGGANPVLHRFWEKGDPERGRTLYHQVGCVACHEADADYETAEVKPSPLDELLDQLDADEIEELGLGSAARPVGSVPHPDLSEKYSRKSLSFFLINPERTRPSGRMPDLKLEPSEAADIAAWLLRDRTAVAWPAIDAPDDPTLVSSGRQLFVELRCVNCHAMPGLQSVPATSLDKLEVSASGHCLAGPSIGRPAYPVDREQARCLELALRSPGNVSDDDASSVHMTMLRLNCYGCHERDGLGGVGRNRRPYFETTGQVDIGDEGRIPPPLTGVGHKMHSQWIKRVLQGTGDVRPYLLARMPRFPDEEVATLPVAFEHADRSDSASLEAEFELVESGRTLMDTGCVQCHLFGGEGLPGVVGIDLAGIATRIRPEWFREFLLNPNDLKPRTRMPTFFPAGTSQNPEVLGGDPERQIAAMWSYLSQNEQLALPDKIAAVRRMDFELRPDERPIVLRAFMPVAGTHAVAVGFPEGVHFSFDSLDVQLAQAWRGRFLDAQGTWFSRFTPPAEPLGDDLITLPPGVPFAWLSSADAPWPRISAEKLGYRFGGYRLDRDGIPTFLYSLGSVSIEDRIVSTEDRSLKRLFRLEIPPASHPDRMTLHFRAHHGKSLTVVGPVCRRSDGVVITLDAQTRARLRKTSDATEWIVPINRDTETTFEVEYRW